MSGLIDLTGERFGYLVVTGLAPDRFTPSGQRKKMWACICDCGNTSDVNSQNLRRGMTRSCGCIARRVGYPERRLDLVGERFGRLTVLEPASKHLGRTAWLCLCDCGSHAVRTTKVLREGLARSCGCLQDESRRRLNDHVTYAGAHLRVRRTRGAASSHACIDCDAVAADWSYIGNAGDELIDVSQGPRLRYSPDPANYVPRCRPCHRRYDKAAA